MPIYVDILNYMFNGENAWLKVLMIGHFSLTTLGAIGSLLQTVYLFYNVPLILLLFWSIRDRKSKEPLQLVMIMELCSIVMDIVHVIFQIGLIDRYTHFITYFSLLVALIHLTTRPLVMLYLLKKNNDVQSLSADSESNADEELGEVSIDKNPFESTRLS